MTTDDIMTTDLLTAVDNILYSVNHIHFLVPMFLKTRILLTSDLPIVELTEAKVYIVWTDKERERNREIINLIMKDELTNELVLASEGVEVNVML